MRYGQDLTVYEKYFTEYKDCIICGGKGKLWARLGPFTAVSCKCGFVWMNPCPNSEGLSRYYTNYIGRRETDEKLCEDRLIQYRIDADYLEHFASAGKLLDVGCSGGHFLEALSGAFYKHGIDVDPEAVKLANGRGFNVTTERIEDYEGEFDVVVMRGVIEHFPDPREAIEGVKRLLRKGGFFYIAATPDVSSFCADLYRENWNQFQPVEHLSHFSVKTLTKLLSGFEYVAHHHPYIETPYQDIIHDYEAVRNACRGEKGISPAFWGNMMNVIYRRV